MVRIVNTDRKKLMTLKHEDKLFLKLVTLTFCLIGAALLWNQTHRHFYVDWQWVNGFFITAAGMFALYYIFGLWTARQFPYLAIILKSIGMIFLTWLLLPLLNTAAFTTPCSNLYDHFFNQLDLKMGFHLLPILQWMRRHPVLHHIAIRIYIDFLFIALLFPIALAIAKQEKAVYQYYCAFVIFLLFSFVIYYFFPTTSPAAVYPHSYFDSMQLNLTHDFHAEHLYQPFRFSMSAIIGFPSLHAAWAALFAYFLFQYRWGKIPAVIYFILVIVSIFPTGWHFLSDVISGVIVAMISIGLSKLLCAHAPA